MNKLNSNQHENDFEFDEWMELYKKDPESFEKQRQILIQSAINQAPAKMHQRLKGLQWRIDSELKLSKNPLDGCIRVYQMMIDSVYNEGGLLDALSMKEVKNKVRSASDVTKLSKPGVF